ncbi:MFS transporter [Rhodococcus sp. WB9]|uniref:MFS transporter n=1 Tax=Rhodococcus sp. WB9 TaxID=2594007 RepID=UPI0021B2A995|nr:MFS transporter [Rhodococcus sp. WB9]
MTTAFSGRITATPAALLGIILASYFMVLLDNSVIFTGLPSIRSGLELSPAALSWVQDAYALVFGGLLLMAAHAGAPGRAWRSGR